MDASSGRPAVSVVTPVWNAAATLAETVASVRAQSLANWEMLLVDDGSTDGSGALAARLAAEEPRIRVLTHATNLGAAAARNHAIREARGRWIAFLDADDLWRPEKLALQVDFMRTRGHPLTFTAYRRIAADGRPLGIVHPPVSVTRAGLLRGNVIGCLTAIYDTDFFGKAEMPLIARRQDYGLWLDLLRHVSHAHALPQVLADYRVHPGSLSAGKAGAARDTWRFYREHERLPRLAAAWYFAQYAVRGVAKRLGG
ncbi:glycosyltransferase involved in cell wall biosynthesis [Amaricoccus macauensis]|uniref:Glycosyltransferase involved in cell wall biosynthesis n=1 Tax=Amaricoccus macauensis TaxID=57001 RepID=A0A840STB8_9RHOB|nr:glycosyltransferase family 2 protein [Amaricoccus macauensis]MBB5224424.1 glycosyltransferase involved in cell wall biosynthesis [Amaricoccus macauensis]